MNPEQQEQNFQTNTGVPQQVPGFTEVVANPVQEKIAKLNKSRSNSTRVLLFGIVGILVGFGTCAAIGEAGIVFGHIILGVSALSIITGVMGSISSSWQISYFQNELRKGSTSTKFPVLWMIINTILSLVLSVIALLVIGFGLCIAIISVGNF